MFRTRTRTASRRPSSSCKRSTHAHSRRTVRPGVRGHPRIGAPVRPGVGQRVARRGGRTELCDGHSRVGGRGTLRRGGCCRGRTLTTGRSGHRGARPRVGRRRKSRHSAGEDAARKGGTGRCACLRGAPGRHQSGHHGLCADAVDATRGRGGSGRPDPRRRFRRPPRPHPSLYSDGRENPGTTSTSDHLRATGIELVHRTRRRSDSPRDRAVHVAGSIRRSRRNTRCVVSRRAQDRRRAGRRTRPGQAGHSLAHRPRDHRRTRDHTRYRRRRRFQARHRHHRHGVHRTVRGCRERSGRLIGHAAQAESGCRDHRPRGSATCSRAGGHSPVEHGSRIRSRRRPLARRVGNRRRSPASGRRSGAPAFREPHRPASTHRVDGSQSRHHRWPDSR